MTTMGLREARADFSAVLKRVARGEAITVTRHGVAMAHLMPPKGGGAKAKASAPKAKPRAKARAKKKTGRARR
jgi:prevent-host-death family protein